MGLIAAIVIGFSLFVGINAHQSSIKHEKALKVQYTQQIKQKELALAKAQKPKKQQFAKLNGIEIADLSGDTHA